jgi:hypothetical protein
LSPINAGAALEYAQICHLSEVCEPYGSPAERLNDSNIAANENIFNFVCIFISP